ncbi:MAG TPA: SDR family NAD(P)-dependent oxidoreductase, partial [Symbiobacteriaceae bacterium]|nr:SDR family NAD(P)-dependent oxidoreductase [Symbiobacteriaceae bacterium]
MELAGQVALVTGASRGIGRATARLVAAAGATVIVNYREQQAAAESLVAEIEAGGG